MALIIAIGNQKGGVGKTTTVISVGAELKRRGYRTLCIDLDPQANLSAWAGADRRADNTVYDVLKGDAELFQAIQALPLFDIAPAPAEGVMGTAEQTIVEIGKEFRLRDALQEVRENYDFILLDNKPDSLSVLPVNSLAAADSIILTAEADGSAADGIYLLGNNIKLAQKFYNPDLVIDGILLTKYSERINIDRDMGDLIGQLAGRYDTHIFETKIRYTTKVKAARSRMMDIGDFAPKSTVAADYRAFVTELLDWKGMTQ